MKMSLFYRVNRVIECGLGLGLSIGIGIGIGVGFGIGVCIRVCVGCCISGFDQISVTSFGFGFPNSYIGVILRVPGDATSCDIRLILWVWIGVTGVQSAVRGPSGVVGRRCIVSAGVSLVSVEVVRSGEKRGEER